jgi:AraC-like DNA-binding protein/mannose-6-phosphate isomerase-like protein (cupin superfamily)
MVYQAIIKPKYEFLRVENFSHNFPMHFHKRLCIGKVISGEKYIKINNHEKKISRNEIFIIPPYTAHSCKTYGNIDYMIFCLNYNEINNIEIIFEGAKYLKIDTNEMVKLINNTYKNIFFRNKIINFLIQYLEEKYNYNIKTDELANKLGYNKYYILHLFKEKMGISLHQYIIQLRIKEAKRKNKVDNLLSIALDNGFFDQSHFIKHFKKYEGITPKEYYKSIIEN